MILSMISVNKRIETSVPEKLVKGREKDVSNQGETFE